MTSDECLQCGVPLGFLGYRGAQRKFCAVCAAARKQDSIRRSQAKLKGRKS